MADIDAFLEQTAAAHPTTARESVVSTSAEGRPIKAITLGDAPGREQEIVLVCGQHAREWIAPAACTYLVNELVVNRARYPQLKDLTVTVVPVANPDGYEYSRTFDRRWRKNRRSGSSTRCQGVDLNRNWGYKWGGEGTSPDPCTENYRGPHAFSEPETRGLRDYFLSRTRKPAAVVDIHSYGQYILVPYGYDRQGHMYSDYQDLLSVGRQMSQAIYQYKGKTFRAGNAANVIYPAAGSLIDWAKGTLGSKYDFGLELRDDGRYGFNLPAGQIIDASTELAVAVRTLGTAVSGLPTAHSAD
ncbi:M14 family metallopeptidase [Streptomyces alanosinicus]|uniref:M14 family metallopeptidase n=1 Tax=Streptomyces alanosinicus TaxID=68171 RepID=UPI001677D973|nr:M14 metallopeptidase family protein [Streptomyces alanosinicus]